MSSPISPRTIMALFSVLTFGTACSDQIVYRDRDRQTFETPPAAAGDFLGYSNVETKRTTCGNCHSGRQAQWQQTAHADAFASGARSTAWKADCEACHSVSSRGNITTAQNVGWVSTKNARYKDVQCESCHGPGLTHVLNPDQNTKPLATIAVGTSLERGCGQCHSGAHQPFAEEWASSRHARVVASRATNASCVGCHEPKAVLASWGVRSTFMEQDTPNEVMAITCAVCHDPHENRNPKQLRFPVDVPEVEKNLCMKCHYRRSVPEVASSSGPHSPQGPVLLGEAGWVPPNFVYPPGSLVGSHGSDRNPKLCATCHVNKYTVTDQASGATTFTSTGHSFKATPCVDANGIPTNAATCEITQKSFRSCTTCHLTEQAARSALIVARERLERLAVQIENVLPAPHGKCTANCVPASAFSTTDNRISTGEGARFNMQLAREGGSAVHNPFLVEALLLASLNQIRTDYGIQASISSSEMTPRLTAPPRK